MDAVKPLVDFVIGTRFEDLPADVVGLTKRFILDNIGAIFAGSAAKGCPEIAQMVMDWGGKPESRLLGWGTKVPMPEAVWINSTQSRALELDDVHERGLMHATSGSVPVALAVADLLGGSTGKEFILAVALGMEVSCRLAMAPRVSSAISGMSFTYQCTSFGGAVTAGKMFGFNPDRLQHALGITYSQIAGNQQTLREGALMTRVQQGLSAKTGAFSALLARAGITGPLEVFEGRFGYFRVYHGNDYDREAIIGDLGERWEIRDISSKPYPCCRFIHSTVCAISQLLEKQAVDPASIAEVKVHIDNREHFNLVCEPLEDKRRPRDISEAQFSVPFVTAATLRRGALVLADFTDAALADKATLTLAEKVTPCISENAEHLVRAGYPPARVEVRLSSGDSLLAESGAQAPGHPRNPLSEDKHLEKFRDCIEFSRKPFDQDRVERIIGHVLSLEKTADISSTLDLLAQEG